MLTLSLVLWSPIARAQESKEVDLPPQTKSLSESSPLSSPGPSPSPSPENGGSGLKAAAKPWETQEAVRPAAPDVYLLPDASGKLRKVLGFRYEDFFEAWQRDKGDTVVTPPRYVLDAWEITGDVSGTHARLRVEFEITVQATGWIDIPVQLPEFIVQQLTIDNSSESECLVFDKQRHGHVIWLSGQVGQKRKLVLQGLARLKLNGGSHSLELHLPRATTSQFALRVPDSSMRFESSPEVALTTVALDEDATEVRLLGQANPLRLSWTPAEKKTSNPTALFEVEGQTTIRLDRRRVLYEATLKINSLVESPLGQIQVRLPPAAKLNQGKMPNGYDIQEIGTVSNQDPRQVVEIRRSTPSQNPWEIRLTAESPFVLSSGSVEGFEVLNAFRQSGTVTLEIDDQLQAYFDLLGDIDQTLVQKTASASEGSTLLGQFRYARFPWQLVVYTSPRQKRVSVKPEYQLTFNSEEALLKIEYDYQFTGAKVFSLRINLQGWETTDTPVESGGLIDLNGDMETREGLLVLPLVDPEIQQLRLNLNLRKKIQLGENTLFLPEALEANAVDGELLVDSTEAIQVSPNLSEMTGLSVIAKTEGNSTDSADQDTAKEQGQLRLRTFLALPKFSAEVTQRQRQVVAAERTQVEIDQQTIRVRQRIDYQAKYQPVSQLSLSLPESLWLNDSLTVTLNGASLPFGLDTSLDPLLGEGSIVGDEAEVASEDEPQEQMRKQILVSLPRPMLSDIPIEISYELPMPKLVAEELSPVLLPLALPKDRVSGHKARVSAAPAVLVTVNQRAASDAWKIVPVEKAAESTAATSRTTFSIQTDEKLSFLSLHAQLDSIDKEQPATLERAWIQSWITTGQRQERAVFRFRTTHDTVFAQLPQALGNAEIEVLLDGTPWHYKVVADQRLAISLPTEKQRESHTLELRYQTAASLPSWGKLPSSLPRLECQHASAPIYWQLILPRGWQVATSPEQLLPDYWLGWKNYRWGRQPSRSQTDLEQITGAVSAMAPTPLSAQYVYRAFEMPTEIEVVVIRQVWLLLVGTLVAFGLGLLALKTSILRSGPFWLVVALALMVGIFSYPEVALLAIQVVFVGGVMTFATSVLRRVFVQDTSPSFSATNYPPPESSVEATELWQPQQRDKSPTPSETTVTLRTGGASS
ncbi:MAG: hypothetical protein GXP24_06675 [Planctomycetes bacterium]|nr:hypothetical protein [Planctomycetota bacterium]